jgi:hypothetical protein
MRTNLQVSLGGGHARVHLDVDMRARPTASRSLGLVTLLLVVPVVLVVGSQSLGLLTGWYSLDRLMNAPGPPWIYLLTSVTFGVFLAVVIVLVARLRIGADRRDGLWRLTVTLGLTMLEAVVLGIAAVLFALFVAHLLADGLACARGVREAC